jgi:hypothetical protein
MDADRLLNSDLEALRLDDSEDQIDRQRRIESTDPLGDSVVIGLVETGGEYTFPANNATNAFYLGDVLFVGGTEATNSTATFSVSGIQIWACNLGTVNPEEGDKVLARRVAHRWVFLL